MVNNGHGKYWLIMGMIVMVKIGCDWVTKLVFFGGLVARLMIS